MRIISLFIISLWFCAPLSAQQMNSPSGVLSANLFVDADGALSYTVSRLGAVLCDSSALGVVLDNVPLYKDVSLKLKGKKRIDEKYNYAGSHSVAHNNCMEYEWSAVNRTSGYGYTIVCRLFDDGFAYRILLPGRGERRINREVAQWRLPQSSRVWFAERNSSWKLLTYAGEWVSTSADKLHSVSSQGPIQIMPLVYNPDGSDLYLVVCEAALYNYSGMRLMVDPQGALTSNFTEPDGFVVDSDIATPWRVLIVAQGLNALVNNDVIANLAPQPDKKLFKDTSWIKPGRSLWSWWSGIDGRYMTLDAEREVIDIASQMGYEYSTLDEGWENFSDKWSTLRDVATYAAAKNVGLFVWRHWNQLNNPADDYAQMRLFMDSVSMCGVKGLKIDFMNGEGKVQIDFTTAVLENAARRKLLINFHGCQKPSGEAITYPNELTREGVRGIELNRITTNYYAKQGAGAAVQKYVPGNENQNIPASHNAALPFTRCVVGAADYTPVAFSMPGETTMAHQLATAYLINSPLQTIAENPFYLLREKRIEPAMEFLRTMPVQWDQTIVLAPSKISEQAVFARRSGDVWYLAAMNTEPMSEELKLDFLGKGEYVMTQVCDDRSGGLITTKRPVTAGSVVSVALGSNSGFVARFEKK